MAFRRTKNFDIVAPPMVNQPPKFVPADPEKIETMVDKPSGAYRQMGFGQLVELPDETKNKIRKFLKEEIRRADEGSAALRRKLRRWNDLYEQRKEAVNYPWDGAANMNIPVVPTHINTLHSVTCRSMLTPEPTWYVSTRDDSVKELVPEIEDWLTQSAKNDWNVHEGWRETVLCAYRDGLSFLQVPYVIETEVIDDLVWAESVEDFDNEFQTPDDASMGAEEFQEERERVAAEASEENPYPIEFERVVTKYDGPKCEVVELADFVLSPANARSLDEARIYGKRLRKTPRELREAVNSGLYWSHEVERIIGHTRDQKDAWTGSRDRIEGVSDGERSTSGSIHLREVVAYLDLFDTGVSKRYIVTYGYEQNILIGVCRFPYISDFYVPARVIKRTNRLIGRSSTGMLEDLSVEVDHSINQQINSWDIEMVPSFKGKKSAQGDFDPNAEGNEWRPGVFFWLADPDTFQQLQVRATDKSPMMAMRNELMRYAEMLLGPTQLLSGRESPIDPDAPGNKTIALIQQSNMRIEDYINELRLSFDKLGMILISRVYQFGKNIIEWESSATDESGRPARKELKRKFLRAITRTSTHGVTAVMNPDVEFNKQVKLYAVFQNDPMIDQYELKNRLLVASRVENRESLLPRPEDMEAEKAKQIERAVAEVLKGAFAGGIPANGAMGPVPPEAAAAAAAAGVGVTGVPMPGAPPGAVGLPPVANLPPGGPI